MEPEGDEDWKLFLKPKRQYTASHSNHYIQFVDDCVTRGEIKRLSPKSSLYEVVRQSKIVLAPPFSSPVIIARELGVPCAFYFLPEPEWLFPKDHHGVEVISTASELQNFLSVRGRRSSQSNP